MPSSCLTPDLTVEHSSLYNRYFNGGLPLLRELQDFPFFFIPSRSERRRRHTTPSLAFAFVVVSPDGNESFLSANAAGKLGPYSVILMKAALILWHK